MRQAAPSNLTIELHCEHAPPLQDQIDAAVQDRTTPISRLLRLMSALDSDKSANENLRLQLRARIGAPLSV
ncbi:hypothetical protein G3T14_16620 [Methylobacterium sp. BTF04]|uniref:hypothetical protein n=1 Tax=Methylobacterium sp. BTF04 TaxID=2708300 RepID=UPI0013D7E27D|nr:hypothetical protein [Methylobacterium sp. BTF04]NEU13744.1 hypothetical protein [Methylobacterium sp. BTF04]